MRFRLVKDLVVNNGFGETVFKKGDIFSPNEDGIYEFIHKDGTLSKNKEDLEKSSLFELVNDLVLDFSELETEEDEVVKKWRIQLDVKTSFKKLKLIEKFIKENVNDML